jgi:hypothetical protein
MSEPFDGREGEVVTVYEASSAEIAVIAAQRQRQQSLAPRPKLKTTLTMRKTKTKRIGEAKIEIDHKSPNRAALLGMSVGTTDWDWAKALLKQISRISVSDRDMTDDLSGADALFNDTLAIVQGIQPKDELEGLLAVQMAAIHGQVVAYSKRLLTEKRVEVLESYERALNRLGRTFAMQVEVLKKYRSKGDQKVTVEHVHVYPGGQAAIGTFSRDHPGGGA